MNLRPIPLSLMAALILTACATVPRSEAVNKVEATQCDRMTAYKNDEGRISPPVARADIDLIAAVAACQSAVMDQPDNGRLHYQLGRVLGYSGDSEGARQARERAAELDYPAAIFVLGYLDSVVQGGDRLCQGAKQMERAAALGSYAGRSAYPAYRVQGLFKSCEGLASRGSLIEMLKSARAEADDYYKIVLTDTLIMALSGKETD